MSKYYISRTIDISGPDGNVLALMAIGTSWLKDLDHREQIGEFRKALLADDYKHALAVFREWFGEDTISKEEEE